MALEGVQHLTNLSLFDLNKWFSGKSKTILMENRISYANNMALN